ncbi:Homoserine dehydrogenase [Candidatus Terasakiella magnetica]|uniref:Homoserine dehydrogenase n=1 Tax=Candidatus Terasakiella magnetica TaxID=1867952 RepID=A0A1C3RC00_9PROT|nr:homoserine dehydrogenase [Candidatus Terasakiella magnetica]SCA54790.1 Homoserine dehydrogenase [Candidatus Terasakiella magnetica]
MDKPLKIAIAGLGTVGAGVIKVLNDNKDLMSARCGRSVEVTAVSARDRNRDRGVSLDSFTWYDNPVDMASDDNVDVVVELIGGSDGIAKALCEKAIENGKHVVTANKALIAHHGTALAKAAEAKGVNVMYEAAVAGGIPIIKALREGLAGNGFSRVYGILNGTCNYMLTNMRETGRDFDVILSEAQDLGYAEADPTFDVDGIDAAHKLAILTSVAFGCEVDFDGVQTEGIRHVSPIDIEFAEELGYRIKLLGITSRQNGTVEQRVHPCMVSKETPISQVEDVFNAVVCEGNFVDKVVLQGRGAGEGPTASAVVGDLVDIARSLSVPTFSVAADKLEKLSSASLARHKGSYYVRLMVVDKPGVFADIAGVLKEHNVSMETIVQRNRAPGETVPLVLTLHETSEDSMLKALDGIGALDSVVETPRMIRIEDF